jgi:hypothetical protein
MILVGPTSGSPIRLPARVNEGREPDRGHQEFYDSHPFRVHDGCDCGRRQVAREVRPLRRKPGEWLRRCMIICFDETNLGPARTDIVGASFWSNTDESGIMNKRVWPILALAFCIIAATGDRAASQSAATPTGMEGPPGGMQLLVGYQHRRAPSFEGWRGRIWKDGGPQIDYDISLYDGNAATAYPQMDKSIWRTTLRLNGISCDLTVDEAQDILVISFGFANFTATRVKSRRDATEVLLMVLSYDTFRAR